MSESGLDMKMKSPSLGFLPLPCSEEGQLVLFPPLSIFYVNAHELEKQKETGVRVSKQLGWILMRLRKAVWSRWTLESHTREFWI